MRLLFANRRSLSRRVTQLERRLDELEGTLADALVEQPTPAAAQIDRAIAREQLANGSSAATNNRERGNE